jgi:hypothetical protein
LFELKAEVEGVSSLPDPSFVNSLPRKLPFDMELVYRKNTDPEATFHEITVPEGNIEHRSLYVGRPSNFELRREDRRAQQAVPLQCKRQWGN